MENALLCMLGFFLINNLMFAHADETNITLTADKTIIPAGGSVTLTCTVEKPAGSSYELYRRTSSTGQTTSDVGSDGVFNIREGGFYSCRTENKENVTSKSNEILILEKVYSTALVTLQHSWSPIFRGETITLRCEMKGAEGSQWTYEWRPTNRNSTSSNEYRINTDTEANSGEYRCLGRRDHQLTEWSDAFRLPALSDKPKATVTPEKIFLPAGDSVTLTCSVFDSDGWTFDWFRQNSESSTAQPIRINEPDGVFIISDEGVYTCRGGRGDPVFYTETSNKVDIKTVSIYVTRQQKWSHIFRGETVTLRCEIKGGGTEWTYEWRINDTNSPTSSEYKINKVTESDSGEYSCRGRRNHQFTQWSDNYSLSVLTNKPRATMKAGQTIIPAGGRVTLGCSVDFGDSWKIYWFKQESDQPIGSSEPDGVFSISDEGVYSCRGGRGDPVFYTETSDEVILWKTVFSKATITWKHNWPQIFRGERISLRCEIKDGGKTQWMYEWKINKRNYPPFDEYMNISARNRDRFSCRGNGNYQFTRWSDDLSLTVSNKPKATVTPATASLPVGGSVTLTCSVEGSAGWTFDWYKKSEYNIVYNRDHFIRINGPGAVLSVTQAGVYKCMGGRGNPVFYTEYSDEVDIKTVDIKLSVTQEPNWSPIFRGERIILKCEMRGGGTQWMYEWRTNYRNFPTAGKSITFSADSDRFSCRGKGNQQFTQWTNYSLTVSNKPKATITSATASLPVGGSVTLTCSVEGSTGWTFDWYKKSEYYPYQLIRISEPDGVLSVTQEGVYICRGGRGDPLFYTEYSDEVDIKTVDIKLIVTREPNWSPIFSGERITLRCEIRGGGTWWTYEWRPTRLYYSPPSSEYRITKAHIGTFSCRGKGNHQFTQWTQYLLTVAPNKPRAKLTVKDTIIPAGGRITLTCSVDIGEGWKIYWLKHSYHTAQYITNDDPDGFLSVSKGGVYSCRGGRGDPVFYTETSTKVTIHETGKLVPFLSVSPSWLNPGASVTLSCEVQPQDAGWRFFWYKAVIKASSSSYSYELLPVSTNGTEQNFTINGSTHTAGFVCRAGKGEPADYTDYSEPKFIWSADPRPAASLSVNPDRVQHFRSESVSLSCEGKTAGWRVMRFTETGKLLDFTCSIWGTMTGSTCTINMNPSDSGVYWCESGSGDFSNAVNITVQNDYFYGIILLSPVHPVTEGDPVTLSCRDKEHNLLSNVFFYHNDKLIHSDSREQLNISAVSKSDEGFYKCQHSGKDSSRSWMSVREPVSGPISSLVMLIVGPVVGFVLIILLILLWRCRRSKDLCCSRSKVSQNNSQTFTTNQTEHHDYSSLHHDNVNFYENVGSAEAAGNATDEPGDVTYALIDMKTFGKKRRPPAPEEGAVYSEVKTGAADSTPVYAAIDPKKKTRKKKGNLGPAAAEAAVYSDIRSAPDLRNKAVM